VDTKNLHIKQIVLLELLKRSLLVLELFPRVVGFAGVDASVSVVGKTDVDLCALDACNAGLDHTVEGQVCACRD
jgi:hypothetical protein